MPPVGKPPAGAPGDDGSSAAAGGAAGQPNVVPAMSEVEIRAAGLAVDVPFETGTGEERLKYASLGPDKAWTPPDGWPDNQAPSVATTPETVDEPDAEPTPPGGGTKTGTNDDGKGK